MAEIHYRPARPEDHPEIVRFQIEMARETEGLKLDQPTVERGVRAVLDDPAKGTYYVAELQTKTVASLLITREWSDWRDGDIWWIQSVYVEAAQRRKGVFTGLYAYVKQLAAQEPKVQGLRLYVEKSNHHAQRIYSRLGMKADHYDLYEWMKSF